MPGLAWSQPGFAAGSSECTNARPRRRSRDRAEGLIKLDVLVTDATGKPVSGLLGSDFSLLEKGRPQKILSFQAFTGRGAGTEPPVKIILLIDTVESACRDLARDERVAVESLSAKGWRASRSPASVFLLTDTGLWTVSHPSERWKRAGAARSSTMISRWFATIVGWQRATGAAGTEGHSVRVGFEGAGADCDGRKNEAGQKAAVVGWPGLGHRERRVRRGKTRDRRRCSARSGGSQPCFAKRTWFSTASRWEKLIRSGSQLYKDYLDGVRSPHKASFMNVYRKVLAVQSGGRVMDDSLDLVRADREVRSRTPAPFYRISFDPFPADHPTSITI